MSRSSGIVGLIEGAALTAVGGLIAAGTFGAGLPAAIPLLMAGVGMMISGVGSIIAGDTPSRGAVSTSKNSIQPWQVTYGQKWVPGTLVFDQVWGADNNMRDLVIVLAAHSIQSIDRLLFDMQFVQMNVPSVPGAAFPPTPRTPGYSTGPSNDGPTNGGYKIASIVRANDIITVTLVTSPANTIPFLQAGDQVILQDNNGGTLLSAHGATGKFQVSQILAFTPSGSQFASSFTILSGGAAFSITNNGQVKTTWPNYGNNIYAEWTDGSGVIGQASGTFDGMLNGTPWLGTGQRVTPNSPGPAGFGQNYNSNNRPVNPWTAFCSLQGKTAVFLRITGNTTLFPAGLPLISFLVHGKNDIYDPRLGPPTGIAKGGLAHFPSEYQVGDVLTIVGGGASEAQVTIVSIAQGIPYFRITDPGVGYKLPVQPQIDTTGGGGSGAIVLLTVTNGAITGLTILSGGSGYTSNFAATITGDGSGASVTLTVSGGKITGYSSLVGGSLYTVLATTGGSGTGATFQISKLGGSTGTLKYTANAALCNADHVSNSDWGFDFSYTGTLILADDGVGGAGAIIEAIVVNGVIVGLNILNGGSGYTSSFSPTIKGTGTGASVTLTISHGNVTGYTSLVGGTGYSDGSGPGIPIAPLIVAAQCCDEAQDTVVGGTEPLFSCNGTFDLMQSPGAVLEDLLTSCAGRHTLIGGQFVVWPGVWYGQNPTPVDLLAIAAGPPKWRPTVSIRDLYNGCKGTYISPYNKWQATDFPPYAQDALHGYTGPLQFEGDINLEVDPANRRRWLDIHLKFTTSSRQAQQTAKIELLRRRHSATGTFPLTMAAYNITAMDVISASHKFFGWDGSASPPTSKLLEVTADRFAMRRMESGGQEVMALGTEIDVQETDSNIYVWSIEEELTPQGYVQSTWPQAPFAERVCFPWSPGYVAPLPGDAAFPEGALGPGTFAMIPSFDADAQGNAIADLELRGYSPINNLDTGIAMPQISAVGSTAGGSLPDGLYAIIMTARNSGLSSYKDTDFLAPVVVYISGGSGNGSIAVTIENGSGDDGGDIYIAVLSPGTVFDQFNQTSYVWHKNQVVSPGGTSATVTTFDQSAQGGVDALFDHLAAAYMEVVHSGDFAVQIVSVTSNTVTLGTPGYIGADEYAGYTLSLLAKFDQTVPIIILNLPIVSNLAMANGLTTYTIGPNTNGDQIADLTTLLQPLDLVVMRYNATFTADSFTDNKIANAYYPSGADPETDDAAAGKYVAVVLSGADAGDVQPINAVSGSEIDTTGGGGSGAVIYSVCAGGKVVDLKILKGGSGYTSNFSVAIGGHGTGASATLTVSGGEITGYTDLIGGSNYYSICFQLAGQWATMPANGDMVIVCYVGVSPETPSGSLSASQPGIRASVTLPVQNVAGLTLLVLVRTEDINGNYGADSLAPKRDVYIFGAGGTTVVTASGSQV